MTARTLIFGALVAASCGGPRRDAEQALRRYDDGLIAAYRGNDPSKLPEVATPKEYRKVVALIDLKRGQGVALESAVEAVQVTEVKRATPEALTFVAKERWRYRNVPSAPGPPAGPTVVAEMTIEYDFVRMDGRWKMDEGRTLAVDYLEPKGYRPGGAHVGGHGEETKGGAGAGGEPSPGRYP
jgi:hypothetical protein